jgi:hypothetical protein
MSDLSKYTYPVARKSHWCETCTREIKKGEKYSRWSGLDEGGAFGTYPECDHCTTASSAWDVTDEYYGGHNADTFHEWYPSSVTGLRVKVYYLRKWTKPDGTLYDVPTPERPVGAESEQER